MSFVLNANDKARGQVLANCIDFLQRLPADKSWRIDVDKHTKDYTAKQRRSIFGAAYKALMEFAGLEGSEDKQELHRYMCRKFFGERTDVFGRVIPVRTTTKNERGERDEISTAEAVRFYEFLQRQGAEVGAYVPDPDPWWREKAEKELLATRQNDRKAA